MMMMATSMVVVWRGTQASGSTLWFQTHSGLGPSWHPESSDQESSFKVLTSKERKQVQNKRNRGEYHLTPE